MNNETSSHDNRHWSQLPLDEQIRFWEQRAQQSSYPEPASPQEFLQEYSALTANTVPRKPDRRGRGSHSVACLCANPVYFRPDNFKKLPSGEIAKAYNRLVKVNPKTGETALRIRMSRNPLFVQLRRVVGRERGFRPERRALIDALFPLMLSCIDFTTHILTLNFSKLAEELSLHDEEGRVTDKVTACRISRLVDELIRFGVLEEVEGREKQWDAVNRRYFPKHVAFTARAWQMLNVNLDKLDADQQKRLAAEAEGILLPGEAISVRAARARWLERMRHATLLSRREKALKSRMKRRLAEKPLDERLEAMAEHLMKTLPPEEQQSYSNRAFEKLCYEHLMQLNLHLAAPPGTPQLH